MKKPGLVVAAFIVSGCCGVQEAEVAAQKVRIDELEQEIEKCKSSVEDIETLKTELEKTKAKLSTQEDIIKDMEEREAQAKERLEVVKDMLSKFKGLIEAGELSVLVHNGKMTLELPSAILFPSGSAELSEKGKETLSGVAEVLKGIKDREFQVAGHTDNQGIGPDNPFETNWHLSAARAVAVVTYLQEAGVKPRYLSAAGYSQYQPAVPNKGKKNMAKNRRIEITIMPNLDELPDLTDLQRELGDVVSREEVVEEEG